jgi:hypothetical protein
VSVFLAINVLDTLYNPQSAKLVSALLPSGTSATANNLNPTGNKGQYEIQFPNGTTNFTIDVQEDGYFPIHQALKLNPGPPPSLSYNPIQELNARIGTGYSVRDGNFKVPIDVILGQLKDARTILNGMGIQHLDPWANPVMDFSGTNVLNASGAGWDKFQHTLLGSVAPTGQMLYASRVTNPNFLAIYVPAGVTVTPSPGGKDPQKSPLNFHLFYPPWTGVLTGSYPFGDKFIDFIRRYLFFYPMLHKEMVCQQEASQAKPIFIFPIGDDRPEPKAGQKQPAQIPWDLGSQTSILRLLYEVKYFVQRMNKIPYPLQPIGKCAVSGFSSGGSKVYTAITNTDSQFNNNVLKEVYGFDLRQVAAQTFARTLGNWFNGGRDRFFRIYTTVGDWSNAMQGVDRSAVQNSGSGGAVEWQGTRSSLVYVPTFNFWKGLQADVQSGLFLSPIVGQYQSFGFPSDDAGKEVHQLMPAVFLEHALKNSSLK